MDLNVDVVGSLCPDLVNNVFDYLSPKELSNALKFNEQWKTLYDREVYWQRVCERCRYPHFPQELSTSEIFQKYLRQFEIDWKAVYYYCKLEDNFWTSNYKTICLNTNKIKSIDIYQYDGQLLLFRTNPKTLQIMNVFTLETRRFSYNKWLMNVEYKDNIQKHENWIIVITNDRKTIKVYDYESFKEIFEKSFKHLDITCITLYKNLCGIITKGESCSILNIETQELVLIDFNVASMCIKDDRIIVGKHAGIINVLDLAYNHLVKLSYPASDYTLEKIIKYNDNVVVQLKSEDWFGLYVYDLNQPETFHDYQFEDYLWHKAKMNSIWLSKNMLTYIDRHDGHPVFYITIDLATKVKSNRIFFDFRETTAMLLANENFVFVTEPTHTIKAYNRIKKDYNVITIGKASDYNFKVTDTSLFYIDNKNSLLVLNYEDEILVDV